MKIATINKKLKISEGPFTKTFVLSDQNIFNSIEEYLAKRSVEWFKLNCISSKEKHLVFSTGYKILLTDLAFHEISNNMFLLNKRNKIPQINLQEEQKE